jgi:hypothetical protein
MQSSLQDLHPWGLPSSNIVPLNKSTALRAESNGIVLSEITRLLKFAVVVSFGGGFVISSSSPQPM